MDDHPSCRLSAIFPDRLGNARLAAGGNHGGSGRDELHGSCPEIRAWRVWTGVKVPEDMDRLLRAAKPKPRSDFVDELERRILPEPRQRGTPRLVAALSTVAALASVLALLGIAGALPSPLRAERPASAKDDCSIVIVERIERRPYFVTGRDGALRVKYRRESVRRPVKRCH